MLKIIHSVISMNLSYALTCTVTVFIILHGALLSFFNVRVYLICCSLALSIWTVFIIINNFVLSKFANV